jgi:hypothetical protein
MHALRWIAYSTLAGLLLAYGFVALDVRGVSADTPGNTTISGPVADNGNANVAAAVPDSGATLTSYYATSPNYNPYYNAYYYNNYYSPYTNYYYNYPMYNYYNQYYPNYYNYYYNYYLYNYYNIYHPTYNPNPYYP